MEELGLGFRKRGASLASRRGAMRDTWEGARIFSGEISEMGVGGGRETAV